MSREPQGARDKVCRGQTVTPTVTPSARLLPVPPPLSPPLPLPLLPPCLPRLPASRCPHSNILPGDREHAVRDAEGRADLVEVLADGRDRATSQPDRLQPPPSPSTSHWGGIVCTSTRPRRQWEGNESTSTGRVRGAG